MIPTTGVQVIPFERCLMRPLSSISTSPLARLKARRHLDMEPSDLSSRQVLLIMRAGKYTNR